MGETPKGSGGFAPGERGFREIFVNVYLKNEFLCISEPCISNFKFLDSYNNKKKVGVSYSTGNGKLTGKMEQV